MTIQVVRVVVAGLIVVSDPKYKNAQRTGKIDVKKSSSRLNEFEHPQILDNRLMEDI